MSVPLRREPYRGRPKRKPTEGEKWLDEVLAKALSEGALRDGDERPDDAPLGPQAQEDGR